MSAFDLQARLVFPVEGPPLEVGVVTVEGGRIVEVGESRRADELIDLGNAALVPGLVNAHTHLEFSDLCQPLGEPSMRLPDWLRLVLEYREQANSASFESRVIQGLEESLRGGTTTVGEIATTAWDAPVLRQTPIGVTIFRELIRPAGDPEQDVEEQVDDILGQLVPQDMRPDWQGGISPHAPYTVHQRFFGPLALRSRAGKFPLALHLAESPEELDFLAHRRGPLAELLEERNPETYSRFDCFEKPLAYLQALRPAYRLLVIHGNYLNEAEHDFLAMHRETMSVVYCPRTHAFFRHRPYPLVKMLHRGVRVALGTDGRGSNPDLSVLSEMRQVANAHQDLAPATILRLATINGAEALGVSDRVGSLAPGKHANLAILRLAESNAADPHELILRRENQLHATVSRGKLIHQDALPT